MGSSFFYLKAKKSLGQNFLRDNSIIENIVYAAEIFLNSKQINSAHILEIGPGTGILTKALLQNPSRSKDELTAIEKDHRAISGLQETLSKEYANRFHLLNADILKYVPQNHDLCIGNIPYYITSGILMWICKNKQKFLGVILMVQDEVADRLCAETNTKEYSRLTVKMQLNFKIEKLFQVPKECFVPRPKVNSAVIKLVPKQFSFKNAEEEKSFEAFTTLLFSQRRKMLRRILADTLASAHINQKEFWKTLETIHIKETDRPESISPQNILNLFKIM